MNMNGDIASLGLQGNNFELSQMENREGNV